MGLVLYFTVADTEEDDTRRLRREEDMHRGKARTSDHVLLGHYLLESDLTWFPRLLFGYFRLIPPARDSGTMGMTRVTGMRMTSATVSSKAAGVDLDIARAGPEIARAGPEIARV